MKIMQAGLRLLAFLLLSALALGSARHAGNPSSAKETTNGVVTLNAKSDAMRIEGEQRFRANCSRCHAAPHKFPPRVMATVLRHMRVRATITDADMRLILFYMSE
jgi:mono/diheme cytochrome c family protein